MASQPPSATPSPVPEWRSGFGSDLGIGSSLVPLGAIVLALLFLGWQAWLLPTLTDWVSSAVDEGFVSYAAQRIRGGEWPHRDFFYLWTPGTPLLHAGLQGLGLGWLGERAVALLASCATGALVLREARDRGAARGDLAMLAALLAAWSFSLWNIPYASWYAVPFALLGARLAPTRAVAAAACFAAAFWFKQNIGLLAAAGAVAALLLARERARAARVAAGVIAGVAIPLALFGLLGGGRAFAQAFSQIFLFPFRYPGLMGKGLEGDAIARPLTALGLWILSLYFLRAGSSKSGRLVQLGVLGYVFYTWSRDPLAFTHGSFFLVSLAAWPLSLAVALTEREGRSTALALWLPAAGIFLQVFPRADFQHFLFVFPLAALWLTLAAARLPRRYPWLPPLWARLPLLLLVAGGAWLQLDVITTRTEGSPDALGRVSRGSGRRLNEEVVAVGRFLRGEGLREGDPILVLPNATAVYAWTGFRNPSPHLQFFPGYVEGFGARQSDVLPAFRAAGGRFLVVQERSHLEENVPELFREIQEQYQEVKSFPEHFTIYAPRQ